MVFVELTPFIAFRTAQWSDEDLRDLQTQIKTLAQLMKDIDNG